jgi:ribosomal protein L7Ae-like RNA K-turn-binding protein
MINNLGLAYKAKKIAIGTDLSREKMRQKKAVMILLANDASENTQKKIRDKASFYGIDVMDTFTSEQLSQPIGKGQIKVIAILDEGFKKIII